MKGFSSQQTDCIHTFHLKFELIFTHLHLYTWWKWMKIIIQIHNPSFNESWTDSNSVNQISPLMAGAPGYEPPRQQWVTLGFKGIIEEMMIEWRQEQCLLFAAPSLHPPPVSTLTLVLMEGAFCEAWPAPAAARLPVTGPWAPRSKIHFPPPRLSVSCFLTRGRSSNHLRMSWGQWIIIHKESLQTLAWLTLPAAAILQITLADRGAKTLTRPRLLVEFLFTFIQI